MTSRSQQEDRLLRDIGRLLAEVEEGELLRHGDARGAPEGEPASISNAALERIVDQVLAVTGAEAEPAEPAPELQRAEPQNDSAALPGPEGLRSSRKAWSRWGILGVAASIAFVMSRLGSHAESDKVDETVAPSAALAEPPSDRSPWSTGNIRVRPVTSGEYQLQIASFKDRAEADAYLKRLRQRGHRAHVEAAHVPNGGLWYRVRIGPFESKGEALAYETEFERKENTEALLVDPRVEPPLALQGPIHPSSAPARAQARTAPPAARAEQRDSDAERKTRLKDLVGLPKTN